MTFLAQYGPWALVAGASEGVGRVFAEKLAERGLNIVLLARRESVLQQLASELYGRFGVQTRVVAIDLASADAGSRIGEQVRDIDIGFLVYCAGADSNYTPFLASPLSIAQSMLHRNCSLPMELCHRFANPMVQRGRGAVVILGSGAGLAGASNMAAYAASKAFDMVFAEALWCELHPKGVDVLGLILGETDTPALRRLRYQLGLTMNADEPVTGAETADYVVEDCLANLSKGPTRMANRKMRWGLRALFPFSRNFIVSLMDKANKKVMSGGEIR